MLDNNNYKQQTIYAIIVIQRNSGATVWQKLGQQSVPVAID